jgi:hypothetical protein
MANSVGRPKSDVETDVVAVRIPTQLRERLDRYVDLASSRGKGAKFSRNSVVGYAIEFFLEAHEKPQASPRQEPQQLSTPAPEISTRPPTKKKKKPLPGAPSNILKIVQEHPDGLTRPAIQELLKTEKNLDDTLQGMVRRGKLKRIEKNRYVVAEGVGIS